MSLLLLAGCNLLDLDDFGDEPCKVDADCAGANAAAGIDAGSACYAFRCNADNGLCEQAARDRDGDGAFDAELCSGDFPQNELDCADGDRKRSRRKTELCDGIDNDCDQVIDERLWPEQALRTSSIENGRELAFTFGSDGTALIALTKVEGDYSRTSGLVLGEEPGPANELEVPKDKSCTLERGCNFAQIALATRDELVLALGINRASCIDGQVRAGIGKLSGDSFELGLHAPSDGNALAAGVDIDAAQSCTKTQELACQGAFNPALALAPPANDVPEGTALAVWLARDGACDGAAAAPPLALVGLGLRADPRRSSLAGSPHTHSTKLRSGLTVDQRPSLLGFSDPESGREGHLIAHVDASGPLLLWVPKAAGATAPLVAKDAGNVDDPSATNVVLAALPGPDLQGLALAWRGLDGGRAVIRFAELELDQETASDPSGPGDLGVQVKGEIASWPAAALIEGPVLAYAPAGFRADDPAGGWLLLWSERVSDRVSRLLAVRVPQAKRRVLPEPEELASGELAHIFAYPRKTKVQLRERAVLRYGFVRDSALTVGEASCLPE